MFNIVLGLGIAQQCKMLGIDRKSNKAGCNEIAYTIQQSIKTGYTSVK